MKRIWTRHVVGDLGDDLMQRCVICGKVILNYQRTQSLDCDYVAKGFSNGDVYDDNEGTKTKYIEDTDEAIDCIRIEELKKHYT